MSQFEIYFTTPHIIDSSFAVVTPARILARAWQFKDADLDAPMGAAPREFNFTINLYDSVHDQVKKSKPSGITSYSTFVYVEWRGYPVCWGPLIMPEWRMKDEQLKIRVYSQLKRCEAHFLVAGDLSIGTQVINAAHKYKSSIPVDHRGLRLLRDAAENKAGQDYPPLGIKNGTNTVSDSTEEIELELGQQILRGMEDVISNSFGPEMIEVPLNIRTPGVAPYYAQMDTAPTLGTNRSDSVKFYGGYSLDNVDDVIYTPGGKIVTHAHAVDRDGVHRETRVDVDSARENGVWVDWEAVDYQTTDANEDAVLGDGVAQTVVDHYGRPPKFADVILKKDDELGAVRQKYWMEHFEHGDFVTVGVKKGGMYLPEDGYRIINVGLHQENQDVGVRQRITIVPDVTGTYTDEDDLTP